MFYRNIDSKDWKEIPVALSEFPDSDQFCQKKIAFEQPRSHKENHLIKCCITNFAGTHCSQHILLQTGELNQIKPLKMNIIPWMSI